MSEKQGTFFEKWDIRQWIAGGGVEPDSSEHFRTKPNTFLRCKDIALLLCPVVGEEGGGCKSLFLGLGLARAGFLEVAVRGEWGGG